MGFKCEFPLALGAQSLEAARMVLAGSGPKAWCQETVGSAGMKSPNGQLLGATSLGV